MYSNDAYLNFSVWVLIPMMKRKSSISLFAMLIVSLYFAVRVRKARKAKIGLMNQFVKRRIRAINPNTHPRMRILPSK